ncbi:hypothetical protein [Pseudomonas syringae]|uniref:hypothetical protein n=1 Tax=Pseudomonas syringae TaxID=317 RepID=UPI0010734D63|nr:hypothetical protein [Pseudomonas syringae]MDH4604608.1 hypothetical protein [Pseudomonas syringae pv. papulans]
METKKPENTRAFHFECFSESKVLGGTLITRMTLPRWYIASASRGCAVYRLAGRHQVAVLAAHG